MQKVKNTCPGREFPKMCRTTSPTPTPAGTVLYSPIEKTAFSDVKSDPEHTKNTLTILHFGSTIL
jgi:hypothetical protein